MNGASNLDSGLASRPVAEIREARDVTDHKALASDPSDEEAGVDIANDESFPASDTPSHAIAGGGKPAPSSGYDDDAEKTRIAENDEKPVDVGANPWAEDPRLERDDVYGSDASSSKDLNILWLKSRIFRKLRRAAARS
jgi:hypothetical protein